jgi:predicted DNA-binding transcriptional regulator YafY
MATNKHAVIRYQALDKCFRNPGRKYFIEDLIEACSQAIYEFSGNENGIKRRQVLEDIKFMESPQGWNIPLERIRDGQRIFYRYEDIHFSINSQTLNETEQNQLKEALLTLSRFKGMPQFEWVEEISARLDSELGLSTRSDKIIEFQENHFLKGQEHISPLYNAILYLTPVKITYKSFRSVEVQTYLIHPYYLKQYNNRWFLFGLNDSTHKILNLALDRMQKVDQVGVPYIANEFLYFPDYFEDIVGVSRSEGDEIERIILQVSNDLYPYIETKPIHGSQKVMRREAAHTVLALDLIPNFELESMLLSHGQGVKVLEPKSLRDKMMNHVGQLFRLYQENYAD